jgi:hypothetical protein
VVDEGRQPDSADEPYYQSGYPQRPWQGNGVPSRDLRWSGFTTAPERSDVAVAADPAEVPAAPQPDPAAAPGPAEVASLEPPEPPEPTSASMPWAATAVAEPPAEPLALLADAPGRGGARHRTQRYVAGLDDPTPAAGVPALEPPLWRETRRFSDTAGPGGVVPPPAPGADEPTDRTGGSSEDPPLPQRVPAEPDVPEGPAGPAPGGEAEAAGRPRWTAPELAWIADQLRRDDVPREATPTEGFDVDAVLAAVRDVEGVQAASVRTDPAGMHTLRLDLADDADPGEVSRTVARLLLERMGLSTAPRHVPPAPGQAAPAPDRVGAPPERVPPAPEQVAPAPARPLPPARHPPWPGDLGRRDGAEGAAARLPAEPRLDLPQERSRPLLDAAPGPRVVIDQVKVSTFGLDATVEVRLTAGRRHALGLACGPAVDTYLVRLAAVSAAKAIDELLRGVADPESSSHCYVEHTAVVPFGSTEVAVVVVLLVCGGWVEQLTGSALVDGDPRRAVVRATLGAVNRRLEALLD